VEELRDRGHHQLRFLTLDIEEFGAYYLCCPPNVPISGHGSLSASLCTRARLCDLAMCITIIRIAGLPPYSHAPSNQSSILQYQQAFYYVPNMSFRDDPLCAVSSDPPLHSLESSTPRGSTQRATVSTPVPEGPEKHLPSQVRTPDVVQVFEERVIDAMI
jgi:hypothetical protein